MTLAIEPYGNEPVLFHPYDPEAPEAAAALISFIRQKLPAVIHHVGSSSVPGCGGKGIIDLLILFSNDREREEIKEALSSLGFQNQTTKNPFPEERPMRTAAFLFSGKRFRAHVHVVSSLSQEAEELLLFRKALSENEKIRTVYEEIKKQILKNGENPVNYSVEKEFFIREILLRYMPHDCRCCSTEERV
jgi:GrpB-like predicted nucleotidyltransferase (UPF0157 family)